MMYILTVTLSYDHDGGSLDEAKSHLVLEGLEFKLPSRDYLTRSPGVQVILSRYKTVRSLRALVVLLRAQIPRGQQGPCLGAGGWFFWTLWLVLLVEEFQSLVTVTCRKIKKV